MGLVQDLISKQASLESDRANFEQHWQEAAELVIPRHETFFEGRPVQGEKRGRKKFDDTATLALDHGAAAIEGVVSPRGQMWHGIGLPEAIEENQEAQEWADRLTHFLFKKRYSAPSNFASQLHECYLSLLAFGNCVMSVEDMMNGNIRYKANHIKEHYFMENQYGRIDVDYRKYTLSARQILQKFGDKAPEKVKTAFEKEPSRKFDLLHVVMPDEDNESGFRYVSYHVCIESQEIIHIGGFSSFPYIISRWTTTAGETYGRGPAMSVLQEIKMLNAMRKTDIRARNMAVDPPILAADQHTVRKFSMKPNAINYGTLDANGNPLVRPYQTGVNIPTSNDGMDQSREFINRAFFLNLFQILVETPAMTATEVLQRAQEKGQLLTPTAGRQMSELLEPIIMREISIYDEGYGVFEDGRPLELPSVVKEMGGEFEVKYTNPLSKMQLAEEALGVERTIQSLLPLAQIDPTILERVDWKEYSDIMREANGAPAKIFKTEEELEAEREMKEQQQAMMMAAEAAPQVAGAVKDLAQAQSYAEQ